MGIKIYTKLKYMSFICVFCSLYCMCSAIYSSYQYLSADYKAGIALDLAMNKDVFRQKIPDWLSDIEEKKLILSYVDNKNEQIEQAYTAIKFNMEGYQEYAFINIILWCFAAFVFFFLVFMCQLIMKSLPLKSDE